MTHTIELDFGYMDDDDAAEENNTILHRIGGTITTNQSVDKHGRVHMWITSPYRSDLVAYVRYYLGSNGELAAYVVEDQLREEKK